VSFGLDEVSYTYCVSSTGVSKDTVVSFNATRSARKFIPIIVQLWMTDFCLTVARGRYAVSFAGSHGFWSRGGHHGIEWHDGPG